MLKRQESPARGAANGPRGSKLQAVFGKLLPSIRAQEIGVGTKSPILIEAVLEGPPSNVVNVEPILCITQSCLTHRLEMDLRAAKRTHLSCGEVLLPCGLLQRISADIHALAESEPYGIRGCLIYVNFDTTLDFDAAPICRKLSSVKCDPATATTFELSLTLRQHHCGYGWNFIPQFLKNFGRGGGGGTIVVSSTYGLSKKKLYRSNLE